MHRQRFKKVLAGRRRRKGDFQVCLFIQAVKIGHAFLPCEHGVPSLGLVEDGDDDPGIPGGLSVEEIGIDGAHGEIDLPLFQHGHAARDNRRGRPVSLPGIPRPASASRRPGNGKGNSRSSCRGRSISPPSGLSRRWCCRLSPCPLPVSAKKKIAPPPMTAMRIATPMILVIKSELIVINRPWKIFRFPQAPRPSPSESSWKLLAVLYDVRPGWFRVCPIPMSKPMVWITTGLSRRIRSMITGSLFAVGGDAVGHHHDVVLAVAKLPPRLGQYLLIGDLDGPSQGGALRARKHCSISRIMAFRGEPNAALSETPCASKARSATLASPGIILTNASRAFFAVLNFFIRACFRNRRRQCSSSSFARRPPERPVPSRGREATLFGPTFLSGVRTPLLPGAFSPNTRSSRQTIPLLITKYSILFMAHRPYSGRKTSSSASTCIILNSTRIFFFHSSWLDGTANFGDPIPSPMVLS